MEILLAVFAGGFLAGVAARAAFARWELSQAEGRLRAAEDRARTREEALEGRMERMLDAWAAERRELYSRIQAYDPNVGDFTPPTIAKLESRPEEDQQGPRSFTEEELGQMGLIEQADGMLRDTRNDALYESLEDWRFWMADVRKKRLPENIHPGEVQELGWEQAASLAKQRTAAKKAAATA